MEKTESTDIDKKTIYLFKKFARENSFWEEYKKLSESLKKISFIELVTRCEPVELIQSSYYFCCWPSSYTRRGDEWTVLSYRWARICVENNLWHSKIHTATYIKTHIYVPIGEDIYI